MGRPKLTPDSRVLAATIRVVSRIGPTRFTLAQIAKEAGLSAATLVQRFGSKRGLLLAVASQGTGGAAECFAQVRARHRSPLAALTGVVEQMAGMAETPESLANNLAFLEMDLTDPEFHALALEHARATLAGYRALLNEAVAAGELVSCDTARLAKAVMAVAGGSLLSWAILREGAVKHWLRRDLEMLLMHYRNPKR